MNAAAVQHGECVARAVADRQDDVVGVDLFPAGEGQATDMAMPVKLDVLDACREAVFATERFDLRADAFDYRDQPERADMRLAGCEDFLRCAGRDELSQQLAGEMARVLDAGIQLAVGECACATLPELDVGFGIEDAAAP